MPVIGALLLRNEASLDRYLRRVLENVRSLCDDIVVVNDRSTDDTVAVCLEYGATVSDVSAGDGYWGKDETTPRSHLWNLAAKAAGPDGWIYCADGDHELLGVTRDDMRALCSAEHVQAWATVLWDCWEPTGQYHRIDNYWQAWQHPRPWLVKAVPYPGFTPRWASKGIHSGHIPHNWEGTIAVLPPPAGVRHWGYSKPEHRAAKAQKYLRLC